MKIYRLHRGSHHSSCPAGGSAPAPLRYSNSDICDIYGWAREVGELIAQKIGTFFRYSCVDFRTRKQVVSAGDMAFEAARLALAARRPSGELRSRRSSASRRFSTTSPRPTPCACRSGSASTPA